MSLALREKFGGINEHLKEQAKIGGIPFITPDIISNSRKALEATEYAREKGKALEFHKAMFHIFYAEGKDMGNWNIIEEVANSVNLDFQEMRDAVESKKYAEVMFQHKQKAINMGVSGVPIFIFNNELAVLGLQPYEAFQEVMENLTDNI